MILHSSNIGRKSKARVLLESASRLRGSLESLVSAEGIVADIRVFVDMSLVVIEPNKRKNPGLVTMGTSLLLGMQALKYLCLKGLKLLS